MLQNWFANHCNGIWEHQFGIQIDTLDNPGWMLTIDLNDTQLESQPFEEIDFEESSHNWIQCNVNQKKFQGFGGALNLENLIEIFISWSENIELHMNGDKNHLSWMQNWYQSQCNGDWEHGNGIKIETVDNPGWSVSIDLFDTNLEDKEFDKIKEDRSENDWFICFVVNKKFESRCGLRNLSDVLRIFRIWAEG